ncbi:MAG TPA: hypothetical protein VK610_03125, partial [Rhodothermales bacterium]|nr:hypothetical protein [Rhodothermales bacterium]
MRTSFLALRFALPFGVAVLVALGLSGCSGGDPSDPDASIAGTWDLQSGLTNVYATVSTNQNALNPFAPGTGGVVLTGDAAATLRYYLGQSPGGEGYVGNAPLLNGDDVTVLIRLGAGGPTEVEVVLGAPGAGPQRTLDLISYDGASPTTRAEGYIEFHNALFRDPDDATFEVTVNGRLTFILLPLTAGVSAR